MWCNGCAAKWCTARNVCTGWCGRTSRGASETFEEALHYNGNLERSRPMRTRTVRVPDRYDGYHNVPGIFVNPEPMEGFDRQLREMVERIRVQGEVSQRYLRNVTWEETSPIPEGPYR